MSVSRPRAARRPRPTTSTAAAPYHLRLPDGRVVARYVDGQDLDPWLAPRPYLHPVLTMAGRTVTAARPEDHPWHLGVSVGVPDVDGTNLWGGPTFVDGRGYVDLDDRGRIHHRVWLEQHPSSFVARLRWQRADGILLLEEQRAVSVEPVTSEPLATRAWVLRTRSTLSVTGPRAVTLRSPEANGRPGAGYGGYFLRADLGDRRLSSADGVDEATVNGGRAAWVALVGRSPDDGAICTLAVTAPPPRDPWFVRVGDYPGVGTSLAAPGPRTIAPGGTVTRVVDVLVADGALTTAEIDGWASSGG